MREIFKEMHILNTHNTHYKHSILKSSKQSLEIRIDGNFVVLGRPHKGHPNPNTSFFQSKFQAK